MTLSITHLIRYSYYPVIENSKKQVLQLSINENCLIEFLKITLMHQKTFLKGKNIRYQFDSEIEHVIFFYAARLDLTIFFHLYPRLYPLKLGKGWGGGIVYFYIKHSMLIFILMFICMKYFCLITFTSMSFYIRFLSVI